MFILKERIVTSPFGPRIMNGMMFFHYGTDYSTKGPKDGFAPFSGSVIKTGWDKRGGNYLDFRPDFDKNTFYRCYHLSSYLPLGKYSEGDKICVTGNTGQDRWGNPLPHHLHAEVWINGKRVDPEKYDWNRTMKAKILIANIDHPDQSNFPANLRNEILRLGGPDFEITEKRLKEPSPLDQYIDRGDGTFILKPEYLHGLVDKHKLEGDVIHFVHFTPQNAQWEMNHRPSAPGKYKTSFLSSNWWWTKLMVPTAEEAWTWGALHEISHNLFQLLNDRGVNETDSTHDLPQDDFAQEYKTFKKHEDVISGVTPPQTMKFELWCANGKDVWLIKNSFKTLVFNASALLTIADFSDVKTVTQAQLDSVPDSGRTIASIAND